MSRFSFRPAILTMLALGAVQASAQHLWWKPKPSQIGYTCLYGEIQVLATAPTIYYCGCNWWPGAPAGGYTGIQDPGGGRHNMIFSIWDTSPTLHPSVVKQDPKTVSNRFGGEGTGAHTHYDYDWTLGKTYRYYVTKAQSANHENTLCTVYFFDDASKRWVDEATISCPNDSGVSVKTFGGGLNAFLENWSGRDKALPKLALYRMWLGTSADDLTPVTEGAGDGTWGVMNDAFFLAEGERSALDKVMQASENKRSPMIRGGADHPSLTVPPPPPPRSLVRQLEKLSD
jgi:hypothetical protein